MDLKQLKSAFTDILREIAEDPDCNIQERANEILEEWEIPLRFDESFRWQEVDADEEDDEY